MSLVVACVLVRGHVDFTSEYVVKLRNMARRSLPEHRFVCLTDQAAYLPPDLETIQVKKLEGFAWWTKLELFNPKHKILQSGRVAYFDLDVLVVDQLQPVIDFAPGFCLAPHAGDFNGKGEKKVVKAYNSSVMVWDGGTMNDLYVDWRPDVTHRLWGDQDWIGERKPGMSIMPIEWFPRLSQIASGNVEYYMEKAKVVLCKKPKNLDAAKMWPWFKKAWR